MRSKCLLAAVLLLFACGKKIPSEFQNLSSQQLIERGMEFHAKQQYTESLRFFEYAGIKDPQSHVAFFNQACAHSLLGRKQEALGSLRRAKEINSEWVLKNLADPDLAALKGEPDFLSLQSGVTAGISGSWDEFPGAVPKPVTRCGSSQMPASLTFGTDSVFRLVSSTHTLEGQYKQSGEQVFLSNLRIVPYPPGSSPQRTLPDNAWRIILLDSQHLCWSDPLDAGNPDCRCAKKSQ